MRPVGWASRHLILQSRVEGVIERVTVVERELALIFAGNHSRPRIEAIELSESTALSYRNPSLLRLQDSNLDLTAPKAVVLPLHQGGTHLAALVKSARCSGGSMQPVEGN